MVRVLARRARIGYIVASFLAMFACAPFASAATLPQYRFSRIFDTTSGEAQLHSEAVDAAGNIYAGGSFDGTVTFGGSDSRTAPPRDCPLLVKFKNDGTYVWAKTSDCISSRAYINSVAVDKAGNIYAAGIFDETLIFDGVGGTDNVTAPSGHEGSFLIKYNPDGSYGWSKTFDISSGDAFGAAVAVDSNNNIYLTGSFDGTVTFGGSDTITDASSYRNSFTTKYNPDGSYAWTKVFDAPSGSTAIALSIVVDSNNNVYAGGIFGGGSVVFDGVGGHDVGIDAGGNGNTYITKYGSDGSYKKTTTMDTSPGGYSYGPEGMAIDPSGNMYVATAINGTVTIGPGDTKTANIKGAATLVKYNADGSYAWSKVLDDSGGWSDAHAVTTDVLGNVYTTGEFYQTVDFNGTGDPHSTAAVGADAFLTKYNPDGSYAWTQTPGTTTNTQSTGFALVADSFGNVFEGGFMQGAVTFDGPGGSDTQTNPGSGANGYVLSFETFIPPVQTQVATLKPGAHRTFSTTNTDESLTSSELAPSSSTDTTNPKASTTYKLATPASAKKHGYGWRIYLLAALPVPILITIWRRTRKHQSQND